MVCGFGDARGIHRAVRQSSHTDEKWPEVMFINDYAVFIGYLSMAVRGTGILVFTWSTVVLLGGFITLIEKKDFWCLTVITLVQTRVFDAFLNGNINYIGYSFKRLWEAIALPQHPFRKWRTRGLIRALVFNIVLCPLFVLYMFGLSVSPGIALWRLLQRDYGDMAGATKKNLKPALLVLYSLALFQGVLFYYRAICSLEEQHLLKLVARAYGLKEDDKARGSISDYLLEMRVGCEKDPSFARGKNLVTYAAELMRSNSPNSYISGVMIIDMLIKLSVSTKENQKRLIDTLVGSAASSSDDAVARDLVRFMRTRVPDSVVESQRMLMDDMIGPAASSGAIKKFIQMLDSKSQSYSKGEIRGRAMRIVEHFASEIRLSKIPYAIQCVSSLLSNSKAALEHKETSINILRILTNDDDNLRLMSNANDLALKIIRMLVDSESSDGRELHDRDHDRWSSRMALPGMEVIKRIISVTKAGSNNMQLPREILESTDAIKTLESILDCQQCKVKEELQKSVIVVLTQITTMGTSLSVGDEVKNRIHESMKNLIPSLIATFLNNCNGDSSMKKLAGESLVQLSKITENIVTILEAEDGLIVDGLTQIILDQNSEYRKSAADILKHLCIHYNTKEESRFRKLKNAVIDDVILDVLREVLDCWSYDVEEQEALASLCVTVHNRLISQDSDLASRFDKKAEEICQDMEIKEVMTFADLVKTAADDVASRRL